MTGFKQDVAYAARGLRTNPGFTLIAIAMLAVGIGINATVFTVTNAILFKGFPLVDRNDRMLYISNGGCCVSYPDFEDYRAQSKSFEGMGIVHGVQVTYSDAGSHTENLSSNENSAQVFKLVGQRPILGRDFTEADEQPGAPAVAILNYKFWESRYAKDPKVIGRAARLNGVTGTIIGVMPEGFSFPQTVDLWVPLVKTPWVLDRAHRDTWFAFGRVKEGVTFESAKAEIEAIGKRISIEYPLTNKDWKPEVGRFHDFFIGPHAVAIYGSMWGAVGFVLLIASANLANLLLAKAIGRSREISVRIALGASRWRIIRQLLIESVMLSGAGGFVGWWLAKWGVRTYELAMSRKSAWLIVDYRMEQDVLWYLIAISVATGVLFGLAPALRLSKLDVNSTLKDGGRGATGGGRAKHLSTLLVTGEMALAIVLLAGAGVMIRSFLKAHNADIGVNTANIYISSVDLPADKYPRPEQKIAFYDRLLERLQTTPGVAFAALGGAIPSWDTMRRLYELPGVPPLPPDSDSRASTIPEVTVNPSYFRTLGATMLSGREFNDGDASTRTPVAIVNQVFAAKFWPGEDALGKRIRLLPPRFAPAGVKPTEWLTVVGVVSNIMQNDRTRQKFSPVIYLPFRQNPGGGAWLFVKSGASPGSVVNAFRQQIQALDPDLPIYGPMEMADRLEVFWDSRFYGSLFLVFAAIALLLASIGLYTVIAHSVSQRTQEIGVRMAVGASARDVLALVFKQGMLPLAIGLTIGLIASLAVNRLLNSMLLVDPTDPISLGVSAGVLILAATLGCWIPARRAMRVDPVVALRHE